MDYYFAPLACSLAGRMLIIEAGLPITLHPVSLQRKQTADGQDFHGVSAQGQVPVLRFDDGRVLTENIAVLQVLADLAPLHAYLPPRDTEAGRATLQWLGFTATEVHKLCLYPMFNRRTPDTVKDWARAQLPQRLAVAARRLDDTTWLAGDAFTVADAHFGWALMLSRLAHVDGAREGALARYWDLLQARPAFAACLKEERLLYERYA
jgi:glutathione S-transferase